VCDVCMSQSSLEQLFEVDQSALMGGSRQLRLILFSPFVYRNLLYLVLNQTGMVVYSHFKFIAQFCMLHK